MNIFKISKVFNLKIPSFRQMMAALGARLVSQFRIGWRLAFQDPTPAWKKKGVVHGLSGWFDLALFLTVICLGLLNWL